MLTHSLQPCTRLNRLQTTFPRQAGFVRFPFSVVNPFMWRRPVIESLCSAGLDPGTFIVLPAVGPASLYPAVMLTGFFAVEWYALSFISSTLATADLVVDLSASAASLRHTREVPGEQHPDPYVVQREEFRQYLETHCPNR